MEPLLLGIDILQGLVGRGVGVALCVFSVIPGQFLSPRSFMYLISD